MISSNSRLKLLTYNIHGAAGRDGERDLNRVIEVIRQVDADVIALQEVDSRPGFHSASQQMEILSIATGLTAIPGPTILYRDRSYGNVLLTRLPLTVKAEIDLSFRSREPRGAIDIEVFTGSGPLRVIAMHFGLGIRERWHQASIVADHIRTIYQPLVLLGDMNEWLPAGGALRPLYRCMPVSKRMATFPVGFPLFSLDRIWPRPASLLQRIDVHRSDSACLASDHLPLAGWLNMKAGLSE